MVDRVESDLREEGTRRTRAGARHRLTIGLKALAESALDCSRSRSGCQQRHAAQRTRGSAAANGRRGRSVTRVTTPEFYQVS